MKSKEIIEKLDRLIPNPKCPLEYSKDYELLMAVMLSAQSTDDRVNSVTKELFKYDLNDLADLDPSTIEEIIKPVGTQKRKTEYIKKIASSLLKDHDGHVPNDRDYIENLPGVGHKTCNVVLSELYGVPSLAVDTHVTRVSKRLDLAEETDDVIEIERKLCEFFPRESWSKIHVQLVLFGRYTCKAKNPLCESCPFNTGICKKTRHK